jgi:hypothetical protein
MATKTGFSHSGVEIEQVKIMRALNRGGNVVQSNDCLQKGGCRDAAER